MTKSDQCGPGKRRLPAPARLPARARVKFSQLQERWFWIPDFPYPINAKLWGCLHPYYEVGTGARRGYA